MVKFRHFYDRLEELGRQYNHPEVCKHVEVEEHSIEGQTSTIIKFFEFRQVLMMDSNLVRDKKTAKIIAERVFINDYAATFLYPRINVLWGTTIENSNFSVKFQKNQSTNINGILARACENFGMIDEKSQKTNNDNDWFDFFYSDLESYNKTIDNSNEVFTFVIDILAPLLLITNDFE